jgi:hypothetical protein
MNTFQKAGIMSEPSGVPIPEMFQQSVQILTKPSVATFEQFENKGTMRDALIYVAIGAAIIGLFGLSDGLLSAIGGVIATVLGFFVFVYMVHFLGTKQDGTGTIDQVAYTFALFYIPLQILTSLIAFVLVISVIGLLFVPLLPLAALAASIYFGYLAVQSSMNMTDSTKIVITLVLSAIVSGFAGFIIRSIL